MVVTQTKRKKTSDMPDSPPKRVTRARAAKAPDDVPVKPKTTKITTASSKAAAMKKKAAVPAKVEAPAKTTKRKTRAEDDSPKLVDNLEAPAVEETVPEEQPESKTAKGKGQQKKTTLAEREEVQAVEAPKTRGRQTKASAPTESTRTEAPKPRGRSKKALEPVPTITQSKEQTQETPQEPKKKITRGRPAATARTALSNTNISKSGIVSNTKRVKFDNGNDKENVPIEKAGPKRSAMKPTGLNAKPIRKPVAARTARGRKVIQTSRKSSENIEKSKTMPLSPKKVNQVAKSDPISEDELAGEKTPVRALSKSPTKRPMSPIKDLGSVSKLNFGQHTAPSSPAKSVPSSVLASPARRPPPSPFKDALKTSPRRLDLGDSIGQPILLSSRTPKKASLLQESPKRGAFPDSVMKPVLLPSRSPLKASLLQSPARRPASSPMKTASIVYPERSSPELTTTNMTSPNRASPTRAPRVSPEQAASSPFRATKSPEQRGKVHVITDAERSMGFAPSLAYEPPNPDQPAAVLIPNPQNSDPVIDESMISDDTLSLEQSAPGLENCDVSESRNFSNPPAAFLAPAFSIGSSSLRRVSMESQSSEDELASPQKTYEITPLKSHGITAKDFATPAVIGGQNELHSSAADLPFTPLADQLSSWETTSLDKRTRPRQARGMFSLGGPMMSPANEQPTPGVANVSPIKSSFFEDEMVVRHDLDNTSLSETAKFGETDLAILKVSQDSQASEEYGDENAAPPEPEFSSQEQEADKAMTCNPARVFTPVRVIQRPEEMHTVSRVPLRPSAEDTPLKVPRQRSRSFGGPLATVQQPQSAQADGVIVEHPVTPVLAPSLPSQTPSSGMRLDAETPGRTVRKGVVPDVLKGAVVHVDVHTTEGADASGIFVDLLTQMGARCVKQWHWNPRDSLRNPADGTAPSQEGSPDVIVSKIGITHVVYKDGGKRTLEKVRSANGVVHCVGVGWVLDCEREDKWLDEASYVIDTSLVPRGGGRRRKSMEPRALANLNGNLVPAGNVETSPKSPDMSPTKEFLTFDTPASRRETFIIDPAEAHVAVEMPAPTTPVAMPDDDSVLEDGSAWGSPTTPYYLSKGAKLVQQTCPPKQMGPTGLFPISGNIEDQPDETVRRRLIEARRKSLQFSSRVRSPLGRTVSYGKQHENV